MSIEIKIPKEINKYEAKFIGPFTLRQTVSLGICLPVGVGLFVLLKPYVGSDLAGFFVVPPAAIGYLFGWYRPYGMKFETYLKTAFINSFVAPSKRLYKTENYYSQVLTELKKADDEELAAQMASSEQKKKDKKKKYKRSKQAIK